MGEEHRSIAFVRQRRSPEELAQCRLVGGDALRMWRRRAQASPYGAREMAILETGRLRLREFTLDDLDALALMVADEEQMRFYPATRTRDEARAWIGRNLAVYEELGFGTWFIESRATAEFLGYCGIRPLVLEGVSHTEIGWHTRKTSWGRGIATEAALAVHEAAFAEFALPRLLAMIPPDHLASRRVAEKIGMREDDEIVFDGALYMTYVSDHGSLPGGEMQV
jgi:RimJ/RimL family protein N-acetyltransferase